MIHYVALYFAGLFMSFPVLIAVNLWLGKHHYSRKVFLWMEFLWPLAAVLLTVVFIMVCMIKVAHFVSTPPKNNCGRRIKRRIRDSLDAVMEPIVERIVK